MTQLSDTDFKTALIAVLGRIANALEAQRESAHDETLVFPLGDYKAFDWAKIGATIIQSDEFGVSVIRAGNGRMATRRTNEKFGTEIWFSYAIGKNADDTPKYQRVIEFREIKAPEPIGRKTEQALKTAKPTPPATPTQSPLPSGTGEAGWGAGSTTQRRQEIPADLRAEWLAAHDKLAKRQTVPAGLGLYDTDDIDGVRIKIGALNDLIRAAENTAADLALDQLVMALANAKAVGVQVPAGFYDTATATLDELEMRVTTVKNLITAHQNEQAMTQKAPTQQPLVVDTAAVIGELRTNAVKSAGRTMSKSMAADVVMALESIAGTKERRQAFTKIVFERESFAELSDAQRYALHAWLRPAKRNNAPMCTNPQAAIQLRAVLDAAREVPA